MIQKRLIVQPYVRPNTEELCVSVHEEQSLYIHVGQLAEVAPVGEDTTPKLL